MTAPNLYITADAIGAPTGGGKVTHNEMIALAAFAPTEAWDFSSLPRPWEPDRVASGRLLAHPSYRPKRAHFYSGTFSHTIAILMERGTRVTYTCAAHDIEISRAEHELAGAPFDYPHLTDPDQWRAYVRGYLEADHVICPSAYSAEIMRGYGCQRVTVIPHGFDPPTTIAPMPARFCVGYLGQPGQDKGLRYLFEAWAMFNHEITDACDALLLIAGRGTEYTMPWIRQSIDGGSIHVLGEAKEPRDLYDACCLYVQPSASEGFGCEVLEARAHGRPVIATTGTGARDFATEIVPARNARELANAITRWHQRWQRDPASLAEASDPIGIRNVSWERVRARYTELFYPS